MNKSLGAIRQGAGLTQSQVAERLDITQGAISQWESGECYPQPQKIQTLAKLYGVTEGEIIAAAMEAKQNNGQAS